MAVRRLARSVYSWATDVGALRGPLDAARSHPRVRAFARRHVGVLLTSGTTWANLDGALRLLAEDPGQRVVFGPWRGAVADELLYWAPFVRWASERFALDPARVTVVSRSGASHWYSAACGTYLERGDVDGNHRGAAIVAPEPLLALVEPYRDGSAGPRPLLKRTLQVLLEPPPEDAAERPAGAYVAVDLGPTPWFPDSSANRQVAEAVLDSLSARGAVLALDRELPWRVRHALLGGATGVVAGSLDVALLGAFSGLPAVALRSSEGEVPEPDLDLAQRIAARLGGSLTVLEVSGIGTLHAALAGHARARERADVRDQPPRPLR